MPYLSRLMLNPRSRQVRAELNNPYEMHRTLLQAFGTCREDAAMLFRVDVNRASGVPTVLVQSGIEPDWEPVFASREYLLSDLPANPDLKSFRPRFAAGQLLQFRLRANPTVKRNGKRLGRYSEEEQREWLERKLTAAGCGLALCQIIKEDLIEASKHEAGQLMKMPLVAVRFDGTLQVLEPDLLRQALDQGVGSAKAFGFGLLSLAPAR